MRLEDAKDLDFQCDGKPWRDRRVSSFSDLYSKRIILLQFG